MLVCVSEMNSTRNETFTTPTATIRDEQMLSLNAVRLNGVLTIRRVTRIVPRLRPVSKSAAKKAAKEQHHSVLPRGFKANDTPKTYLIFT